MISELRTFQTYEHPRFPGGGGGGGGVGGGGFVTLRFYCTYIAETATMPSNPSKQSLKPCTSLEEKNTSASLLHTHMHDVHVHMCTVSYNGSGFQIFEIETGKAYV